MVLDVGMALPQPNDIAGKSRLRYTVTEQYLYLQNGTCTLRTRVEHNLVQANNRTRVCAL
jgi:hypothetical protein